MIFIENCSGSVDIRDMELDGNLQGLRAGGKSARGGWQAAGTGVRLMGNSGAERIERVRTHHHPQDGLMLNASPSRSATTTLVDVISDFNGRQGCSITGGRNYAFQRCKFTRTGRAGLSGAPGAGVDIEAESSPIRNVSFTDCEFSDNHGFGLVSGMGDSADIVAENCRFIGTTNLAAWPESPRMRFRIAVLSRSRSDSDSSTVSRRACRARSRS